MSIRHKSGLALCSMIGVLGMGSPAGAAPIDALSDRYIALIVKADPAMGQLAQLPDLPESALPPISADALRLQEKEEDALWRDLRKIRSSDLDEGGRTAFALIHDGLEARRGLRVCRLPLWSVNHMTGWPIAFQGLARAQQAGTPEKRKDVLLRWQALAAYVDQDIANLREGLRRGYAVPGSIVARVIVQMDKLLALPVDQSPFFTAAKQDPDATFKSDLSAVITGRIQPALRRYRDFLSQDYAPHARYSIGVSALPDGAACYRALLRFHTTLDRPAAEVMAIGEAAVAKNVTDIGAWGQADFGTTDLPTILKAVNAAPDNHFASTQELVDFSNDVLARSIALSAPAFIALPGQPVAIERLPEAQSGSGVPAHYRPEANPDKPGHYILPLDNWRTDTRGDAEITVAHETIPGHHLQIAMTQELAAKTPLLRIVFTGAYVEGWARYAEGLTEELGIYRTRYARITRRAWMARGMVVDPGIHSFGWSRERATAYLIESGRFDAQTAPAMIDRIAALPGQLASYDSGGLEIAALRKESEQALGKCFDLRQFHQQILSGGALPLKALRDRIVIWRRTVGESCAR